MVKRPNRITSEATSFSKLRTGKPQELQTDLAEPTGPAPAAARPTGDRQVRWLS
jgi:hypothetical protein